MVTESLGEAGEKLLDRVVEQVLKLQSCPGDAVLKGQGLLRDKVLVKSLNGLLFVTRLLESALQVVWLSNVEIYNFSRTMEIAFELFLGPLDRMLNLVWETADCAHWETLVWWILRTRVRFGETRENDLSVALGSECAALKQRLEKEDTTTINIDTGVPTLSRAFVTASRGFQNSSEKMASVSGPTRSLSDVIFPFRSGFIACTAAVAQSLFNFPTSRGRKRN